MEKEFEQNIEQENTAEVVTEQTPVVEQVPAEKKAAPQKAAAPVAKAHSNKRVLTGKVVSNKADKTIVIAVERQVAHPLYKKYYKVTTRFMAHDEANECKVGDKVKVKESRPLSARKRWTLVEIIERAK